MVSQNLCKALCSLLSLRLQIHSSALSVQAPEPGPNWAYFPHVPVSYAMATFGFCAGTGLPSGLMSLLRMFARPA